MKTLYSAKGLELTGELAKYANAKIAHLARKVPRRLRSRATCKVAFGQVMDDSNKQSTCGITLTFDETKLQAKETTQHMYAALDIASVDIEQQIEEYAHTHRHGLLHRRKSVE